MGNSPQKTRPENLLFRSRLEICRILQVLAQEQCRLTAQVQQTHSFSSHILAVDHEAGHFAIAYSGHKPTNSMVLGSPFVEFTATDSSGLNFTFTATAPEEALAGAVPAIQFALPNALLMHSKPEHPHYDKTVKASLRCIADAQGVMPFESHVTDISHEGLGCLDYQADINLAAGTVLPGCRIILPGGDAVIADLELRHTVTVALADGSLVNRSRFRFVRHPDGLEKLTGFFIQDLGK